MPQSSRYSDEKVEGLLSDLVSVLEKITPLLTFPSWC